METTVYNQQGRPEGKIDLPEAIFDVPWNERLVYQTITSLRANLRTSRAQVKDRGEVSGGGKKPWRQKGTGRARHGSIRSPLWRGGGATHGPTTARVYYSKVNKQARRQALFTILSQKQRDQEIIFLNQLSFADWKTKNAAATLDKLATIPGAQKINYKRGGRAFVLLPKKDLTVSRSFRNLSGALVGLAGDLDPLNALDYQYLIIVNPAESIVSWQKKLEK